MAIFKFQVAVIIYIYIYIYIDMDGGTLSMTVIIIENGTGNQLKSWTRLSAFCFMLMPLGKA